MLNGVFLPMPLSNFLTLPHYNHISLLLIAFFKKPLQIPLFSFILGMFTVKIMTEKKSHGDTANHGPTVRGQRGTVMNENEIGTLIVENAFYLHQKLGICCASLQIPWELVPQGAHIRRFLRQKAEKIYKFDRLP